jgi:hypothetical protein
MGDYESRDLKNYPSEDLSSAKQISNKNTVTIEQIDKIISSAEVHTQTIFDKTTVVTVKLENGFVITESSSCVDPANYDEIMGYEICMKRIINKLWELEGYRLQQSVFEDQSKRSYSAYVRSCNLSGEIPDNLAVFEANMKGDN